MAAATKYVYDFDEPSDGGRQLLGGKGIGLAEMTALGVPVHDADAAVHALYGPGGEAAAAIGAAFPGVLDPQGGVDRARLRDAVLGDPDRMAAVLGTLYLAIRDLAVAIAPIVPGSAAKLLAAMGEGDLAVATLGSRAWYDRLAGSAFRLAPPVPIFPRLDPPQA